jgi:hypothetical protein
MSEEEKAALAAKEGANGETTVEVADPLAEKDKEIARLTQEKDNYKAVALKRLGKLPGDADFMGDSELSVAEQIKLALLDKEIENQNKLKEDETKKILRENAELKLALKNRPTTSIGGGDGSSSSVEVKDNIFSNEQIVVLTERAKKLGVDPEKFVEKAKQNFQSRSR